MKKYVKIALLMVLAFGLLSGSAFAAASLNGGNATVASELITAGSAFDLPGTAANTAYQPNGAVAVSTQIKISLTGGSFTGLAATGGSSGLNICDGTTSMGTTTAITAADTSAVVTLVKPLASGTVYTIQKNDCAASPQALGALIRITSGSSSVTMTVDNNAGTDANLYATTTIATVADQLSAVISTAAKDTLDFSTSLKKFKTGGTDTTTTSKATFVLLSNETLGSKLTSGHVGNNTGCGAWPNADQLTLTVLPGGSATTMGAGFHATAPFLMSGFIVDSAIASTDASGTGTVTLNTAPNIVNSCGAGTLAANITAAAKTALYLQVLGTTALQARTFNLKVDTVKAVNIKAEARTIMASTLAWTWTLDATQYYVPLIKFGSGTETYIKLQSNSALVGSNGVSIQVLATDGTMVTVTPATNITSGTPYTLTGTDIAALVTAAGKSVSGANGFAAIITINTPNANIFGYANMIDPLGAKRVPLQRLTDVAANTAWTTIAE